MGDLGVTFAGIVTGGSLLLAIAVAALLGLIGFASPRVLPVVPLSSTNPRSDTPSMSRGTVHSSSNCLPAQRATSQGRVRDVDSRSPRTSTGCRSCRTADQRRSRVLRDTCGAAIDEMVTEA
jgi:hypothetical protein